MRDSLARINSVYENPCYCGRRNCICTDDSSLNSNYMSSELNEHRSPSQDCFEDYNNRRAVFLARLA